MRSDRLLSVLLLLQGRGRMTARELAERLEVSLRTIQRDLDALSSAGVPVYSERGRHGGVALLEGYRTDVSGLTADEARALFLFGGRRAVGDLGLETELQSALRKLLAALPEARRPQIVHAQDRVFVDPHGWRRAAEDTSQLPAVQEAVWNDRRLRVRYRSAGAALAREHVVDPWGVVAKAGIWYLVAGLDGEPRLFRVSRMEEAVVIDEAARRPAGLDLEALWRELRDRLEARSPGVMVSLRARPDVVDRLLRMCAAQLAGPADREPEPDASGWIVLHLPFVAEGAAQGVLLGFGTSLEVLAPQNLRESFGAAARALAELYGAGAARPGIRPRRERRSAPPRAPRRPPAPP